MNKTLYYFSLSKLEQKAFFFIFSITLFALSSLLIANVLYSDDFTRVTTGETLWNDNGRPLSSFVSILLQLGQPLTDVSPLPQLLAFALYALSGIYLAKLFEVNNFLLVTLCGTIFSLNPFNLQNFTFVFDSFPMALAVLTSVLAAFITSITVGKNLKKSDLIYSLGTAVLLLLSSLCLYQAATSVYIVIFLFYALVQLLNQQNKYQIKYVFKAALVLITSLVLYLPIKNYFITNSYNLYHSETIYFSEAPRKIVGNLNAFWQTIKFQIGSNNIIDNLLYVLLIATLSVVIIKAIYQIKDNHQRHKLLFFACLLSYLLLLMISPLGMMLVLKNPIFAPRTMMGFTTLVTVCCLVLAKLVLTANFKKLRYCLAAFFCIMILAFANVSFTLGNVLYAQNIQDEIIATVLISDLGEIVPKLPISLQHPILAVVNSLEYTYGNTKAYEKYPLLKDITWFYLKTNQIQFYTKLETLGFKFTRPHYEKHVYTSPDKKFVPTDKPVVTRPLYNIYFENNDLLVVVLQNPGT